MSRTPSMTNTSNRGSSGAGAGPIYAQTSPPISAATPAAARIRERKLVSSRSAGWSRQEPSTPNSQP